MVREAGGGGKEVQPEAVQPVPCLGLDKSWPFPGPQMSRERGGEGAPERGLGSSPLRKLDSFF